MKNKFKWLMLIGSLLILVRLFLKPYISMSDSIAGFISGVGIGLMLMAVVCLAKQNRVARGMQSPKEDA